MALTFRQIVDAGYTRRGLGYLDFYNCADYLDDAGTKLQTGDYYDAGTALRNAASRFGDGNHKLFSDVSFSKSFAYYWRDALHWIDDNWPEEAPEITMAAILSAMLAAEPDEVQYFVGLTDAYRQSIWNRPFNKEFFAALARGFAIWP